MSTTAKAKVKKAAKNQDEVSPIVVSEPNLQVVQLHIRGDAPYVQNKFSAKAREIMRQAQMAGPTAKTKKKRDAKDFDALYEASKHRDENGEYGIPAAAFRRSMIDACTLVRATKVAAKISVFVIPDAFDIEDGTPLVHFHKGAPRYFEAPVRNSGVSADLRVRAMWVAGWEAKIKIRFDADQFTPLDIVHLLSRAGQQVGIGEGRPSSPKSAGMGWGTFEIVTSEG